jgi:phosphatidate phosphatase PAH1
MELSPLAKERLARIGSLSPEESKQLEGNRELESLLSQYFTDIITSEDLWKKIKELKEQGDSTIPVRAQVKLLNSLRLQMSNDDLKQRRIAILAMETIKNEQKYTEVERHFNSVESIRKKYTQSKEQGYEQLKSGMEAQLRAAVQQAGRQGVSVDIDRSLEANVKNSQQWKAFISELENNAETMFNEIIDKLKELIST